MDFTYCYLFFVSFTYCYLFLSPFLPQTTYDQIVSETKFQLLLTNVVNKSASEDARTMAAVLLRRLLTTSFDEVFTTVSLEDLNAS